MGKLNVVIEHIGHSGFTVDIGNKFLVFDYYKGDIKLRDKEIYVFSSHDHGDHFNPMILDWKNDFENIYYVLSNDIEVEEAENIVLMGPYKEKTINNLIVRTFGSTDKGVSFLVSVDGINIFHAGDLNWWYWDDDPEREKIDMENSFKKKVQRVKDTGLEIDIAFFPVDPRLEEYFHLGGEYFIEEINPKYFFPMHAWDKYEISNKFIHKIANVSTNIVDIEHNNQVFQL